MTERNELPRTEETIEEFVATAPQVPEGAVVRDYPSFRDVLPAAGIILTEEERYERDDN